MIVTVTFEDRQQDFLEWDIDTVTGKVLASRPFQDAVWTGGHVLMPISVGDFIRYKAKYGKRLNVMKYRIIGIREATKHAAVENKS